MGRERALFQVCVIVMLLGAIAAPVGRAAAPALDERDADQIAVTSRSSPACGGSASSPASRSTPRKPTRW
jgi:hypothetical protein